VTQLSEERRQRGSKRRKCSRNHGGRKQRRDQVTGKKTENGATPASYFDGHLEGGRREVTFERLSVGGEKKSGGREKRQTGIKALSRLPRNCSGLLTEGGGREWNDPSKDYKSEKKEGRENVSFFLNQNKVGTITWAIKKLGGLHIRKEK